MIDRIEEDDPFREHDERVRLLAELRESRRRWMLFAPREMKQILGASGLFPGPVVDGGRRAWDWNVNSRWAGEQRWYAGFERATC